MTLFPEMKYIRNNFEIFTFIIKNKTCYAYNVTCLLDFYFN